MSGHLLAVEVGPVAPFIAAARKTRDLWFGSWLVSEIAKAAAAAVRKAGGVLIFPDPADLDGDPDLTVGDEILASVPAGVRPATVADAAKNAVHRAWVERVGQVKRDLTDEPLGNSNYFATYIRGDVWEAQTPEAVEPDTAGEVFECYAAWVPLTANYQADRGRVTRLLAGRTACRNFPPGKGVPKLPKSSLDGARETVLQEPPAGRDKDSREQWERRRARQLRLNRGEQLDAPGVVRRLAKSPERFPSVARVAVTPWVEGAKGTPAFAQVRAACEALAREKVVTRLKGDEHRDFPFEGAVLFPSRRQDVVDESAETKEEATQLGQQLGELHRRVRACGRGEPNPYYALLQADGDGVGDEGRACTSDEENRALARKLSAFAADARDIIRRHAGSPVFVGGDDVLAFLPLHTALACADELRRRFTTVTTRAPLTLSVGVAVAHFLDPLEDVLTWAKEAEHTAKGGGRKNALAVHHQPRGGAAFVVRFPWAANPVGVIGTFADLLRAGQLPDKAAYDLRKLADVYDQPADAEQPVWTNDAERTRAIRADARRLLGRKQGAAPTAFDQYLDGIDTAAGLVDLANTAILARRVADARKQAEGGTA